MANVEHSSLTGSALHEPKGVSTAGSGTIYLADGAGSGSWESSHAFASLGSSTTSSAVVSGSLSPIGFTPVSTELSDFTYLTSPNFRIRYDGSAGLTTQISLITTVTTSTGGGGSHSVELFLCKNGTKIQGAKVKTIVDSEDRNVSLQALTTLATNDYIEIKADGNGSFSLDSSNIHLSILGISK